MVYIPFLLNLLAVILTLYANTLKDDMKQIDMYWVSLFLFLASFLLLLYQLSELKGGM